MYVFVYILYYYTVVFLIVLTLTEINHKYLDYFDDEVHFKQKIISKFSTINASNVYPNYTNFLIWIYSYSLGLCFEKLLCYVLLNV